MSKKELLIFILKTILELAVLLLLVLVIVHLVKSEDGVLAKIQEGTASEKLDAAIKLFTSTDGMKLEQAIRSIDGLNELKINEETGQYDIKIDGQEFMVISREMLPENNEEKQVEVQEKTQTAE